MCRLPRHLDTIPPDPKIRPSVAAMAELADALGSGPSTRKGVQVQLLLAAFKQNPISRFSMASYGVFLWVRANRIEDRSTVSPPPLLGLWR